MKLRAFSLISFVIFELCIATELTLPVITCHRDSADYSICLRSAIQEAWPQFVQGLPQFKFPRLDPFFYKNIYIKFNDGGVSMDVEVSNVTMTGAADAHFSSVKTCFDNDIFQMEINMNMPKSITEGIFKMNGIMCPFKLNNIGYFNVSSINLKEKWILIGHVTDDRWIVENLRVIPTITNMKIYFNGLLNDAELEKLLNEFVNENWPILFEEIQSMLSMDDLESWLLNIINNLFSKVSFSKVFPK